MNKKLIIFLIIIFILGQVALALLLNNFIAALTLT